MQIDVLIFNFNFQYLISGTMDIIGLIYAIGIVPLLGFDSSFISSEGKHNDCVLAVSMLTKMLRVRIFSKA